MFGMFGLFGEVLQSETAPAGSR